MKKAMVLMGLVLAAAVIVPSAAPAKQADIPVGPSLTDIPVGPAYAYIARGFNSDIPVGPSLTDIPVAPTEVAYIARGLTGDTPVAPTTEVAYIARGLAGEDHGQGKGLLNDNYGRDKKSAIIVIG